MSKRRRVSEDTELEQIASAQAAGSHDRPPPVPLVPPSQPVAAGPLPGPTPPASEVPVDAAAAAAEPLLFEVAWEVCWQLGGIYTVLRTKVQAMQRRWGERYFLVGPYNRATAAYEFEERPAEGFMADVLDRLRRGGTPCHFGKWLVAGRPNVILLEHRSRYGCLDVDKYLLWKDHGIGTPPDDGEVNEVVAFGFAVTEFFRHLTEAMPGRRILAHFHEWMGGVAVPRIAHLRYPVTTVFTTHATLLGRYLAGSDPGFYGRLHEIDPDAAAGKYNIWSRFAIERAAAHASTVFTTVSKVTAVEASRLLGRVPDAVLPNGLNIERFAALHEFQNLHRHYKERIHEFVMGHFFPSYTFDLDRTIYIFTSGRYEYLNKVIDVFIEALYRLNERLRQESDPPTVVAFIITRAAVRNMNVTALQSQSMFAELENICADIERAMGRRLLQAAAHGRTPTHEELLGEDTLVRLKRAIQAWRSTRQPGIVTHDLVDDAHDPILQHLRHRNLLNAADDRVKVVFHPDFLSATSPLLSLDYQQFVRGCHMGVFPSAYEPWGYTPMECIAMGLPAVTTDLSGFGAYVLEQLPDCRQQGILVLRRRGRPFDEFTGELVDHLYDFVHLNRRQRIELRNRAERLSEMFDWTSLIQHYDEAHTLALERAGGRVGRVEIRFA